MRKARTSEAMCRQLQQPGHEAHVSLYAVVVDSFQQIRRTLSGRGMSGPEVGRRNLHPSSSVHGQLRQARRDHSGCDFGK